MAADAPGGWKTTSWSPTTGCERVSAGCDLSHARVPLDHVQRVVEASRTPQPADEHPTAAGVSP